MKNFQEITLDPKNIKDYAQFEHAHYREVLNEDKKILRDFGTLHVVHVNTAMASGGVAEILKCQVPLERSLGIDSHWLVMDGDAGFFNVTKKIHNFLQGKEGMLDENEIQIYLSHADEASEEFLKYLEEIPAPKIVILHDPQPLPMIAHIPKEVPVISRIHVDVANSNTNIGDLLKPFLMMAKKVIVSDEKFRPNWLPRSQTVISFPAIDPFNNKNKRMKKDDAKELLQKMGLDISRPIVSQVSRFDPWKDPWGVIEAYKMARQKVPGLQLILAGLIVAEDDPEAQGIYNDLRAEYGTDPDIHLFGEKTPPIDISNDEFINAIQTGSDVIVQKSLREGFGLTVTEALWHGQPVVAGDVGGIKHQINDGDNGFLVHSPRECADRIVALIVDHHLKHMMGEYAHQKVEEEFLMSRLVLDHLKVYEAMKPAIDSENEIEVHLVA